MKDLGIFEVLYFILYLLYNLIIEMYTEKFK
jgi:hypothetical protein